MPPRFKSCPLCSQQFGTASLDIHVPQCHSKLLRRWEQAPLGERGPMPVMPQKRPPKFSPQQVQRPSVGGGGGGGDSPARSGVAAVRAIRGGSLDHGGGYGAADDMPIGKSSGGGGGGWEMPAGAAYTHLQPCRHCGRTFAADRRAKHESVCQGATTNRRKFNAKAQRLDEFRGEAGLVGGPARRTRFGGTIGGGSSSATHMKPRSTWREQHREFQEAMRAARAYPMPKSDWGGGGMGGGMGGGGGGGLSRYAGGRSSYGSRPTPPPRRSVGGTMPSRAPPRRTTSSSGARPASSASRLGGGGGYGGGGGGGGGGRIAMTNDTSAGMRDALGFGGGGRGAPVRHSGPRVMGNPQAFGGPRTLMGGGGGGGGKIAMSNDTSSGMRQAFGRY